MAKRNPRGGSNPIRRFKASRGLTYVELAKIFEITADYARKLGAEPAPRISTDLALRIERRTRGEIRFFDLMRWVYAHHGPRRAA